MSFLSPEVSARFFYILHSTKTGTYSPQPFNQVQLSSVFPGTPICAMQRIHADKLVDNWNAMHPDIYRYEVHDAWEPEYQRV